VQPATALFSTAHCIYLRHTVRLSTKPPRNLCPRNLCPRNLTKPSTKPSRNLVHETSDWL